MGRRPGKGEEDPEEAAMVEQFRANMGDYKLKSASDYVVPKHQRVTFSRKKLSLLFLRNQVHTHTDTEVGLTGDSLVFPDLCQEERVQ